MSSFALPSEDGTPGGTPFKGSWGHLLNFPHLRLDGEATRLLSTWFSCPEGMLSPAAAMYVLPMVLIFSTPLNFGLDSSWEATTVRQLLRRVPIQAEHSLDTLSMDTTYSPFDLGLRGGKNTACISQRACPQNEMQYDDLLPINMN